MTPWNTVGDLLDVHRAIEAAMRQWCRALVCAGDPDEAARRAAGLLRWHMEGEERWLLPLYAERVRDVSPGRSAALIERDHRLIRERLDAIAAGTSVTERLHGVLALSELLEHHDEREVDSLKRDLDPHLSVQERRTALAGMAVGYDATWTAPLGFQPVVDCMPDEDYRTERLRMVQLAERVPRIAVRARALMREAASEFDRYRSAAGLARVDAAVVVHARVARLRRVLGAWEAMAERSESE